MTETPEKPKLSHGGARPNAGAKKSKPATVALRVDARLVELLAAFKLGLKLETIEKSEIDKLTRDFEKRNFDGNGTDLKGKASAEKRLNDSIDKHGAKLKGGMTLFNLLQKCIKDGAVLIKNGVLTEQEIIKKFLAAHDLEGFDEIEKFDQWRGNRRV